MVIQKTKYVLLPLTRGLFAKIDPDDFERVRKIKWHVDSYNCVSGRLPGDSRQYTLGILIMNPPKEKKVINLNGDPLDFRKNNLSVLSHGKMLQHCSIRKNKLTSIYKGVHFWKTGKKWAARIQIDNRQIFIGYFRTEIEAAIAYDAKAIELYGPNAYRNFSNRIVRNIRILDKTNPKRSRPHAKSGFKGVHWNPGRGKQWQVQIRHQGKNFYIGVFDNPIDAALAYDSKAKELFCDNCYLNFPIHKRKSA